MGDTTLFDLTYPEATDPPDGPNQMLALAEDVEGWLARDFPCLSSGRPTGVGVGFRIVETDTGSSYRWDGDSWEQTGGTSGGGGVSGGGSFTAGTTAQSVPNATDTVVAFGTTLGTPTLVTRGTQAAGHKFTLGASGVWAVAATVRFATNAAAGERAAGIWYGSGFNTNLAHDGGRREGLPQTLNPTGFRYLASGTELAVIVYQGSGGARVLEPNSGAWVHIDLWLVG